MSVLCFASLKGGVGKTSLTVNLAHAFATRGCETLVIDLDPTAHASRLFKNSQQSRVAGGATFPTQSPLARLFFSDGFVEQIATSKSVLEFACAAQIDLCYRVRNNLQVLPASPELRYFLWGRGARFFSSAFSKLIEELRSMFDYILIDTAPDFNVVTRNALAVSDLITVPVDSSEMSIYCLEEIVENAKHIKGPAWAIIRSMVNRQASRVHKLSSNRLQQNFEMNTVNSREVDDYPDELPGSIEDPGEFISMVRRSERAKGSGGVGDRSNGKHESRAVSAHRSEESPIYLLNSLVYRTEQQNRLTFLAKTSFDDLSTARLADQYLAIAREMDELLSILSPQDEGASIDKFLSEGLGLS